MTQQALSVSIKSLELEFGATFIRRQRSGCVLTEEGKIFLAYAQKCLDDRERIISCFAERQRMHASSELELVTYSFVSDCLFETIQDVRKEWADMRVNVRFMDEQKFRQHMHAQKNVDSIFLYTIPFAEDGNPLDRFMPLDADTHIIKKNYYVACVGKDSPLSQEREVSLRDVLRLPLVIPKEKRQSCTPLQYILEQYADPNIALNTPSLFSWTHSLRRNVGVSFMQESLVQPGRVQKKLAEHIRFIPLKERIGAYQCVMFSSRPSRRMQAFVQRLEQALDGSPLRQRAVTSASSC